MPPVRLSSIAASLWLVALSFVVLVAGTVWFGVISPALAQQLPAEAARSMLPPGDEGEPDETLAPNPQPPTGLPGAMLEEVEVDSKAASKTTIYKKVGHTMVEIVLSIAVMSFGLIVIILQFVTMWLRRRYWDAISIQFFAIVISTTSALLLITAGFSNEQITPISTILGGILGYAFASNRRGEPDPSSNKSPEKI